MTAKMAIAILFDASMLIYFGIKTELVYIIAEGLYMMMRPRKKRKRSKQDRYINKAA